MTSSSEVCVNLSSSPSAVAVVNERKSPVLLRYLIVHTRLGSCWQLERENACGSLRSPLLAHTSLPLEGADLQNSFCLLYCLQSAE